MFIVLVGILNDVYCNSQCFKMLYPIYNYNVLILRKHSCCCFFIFLLLFFGFFSVRFCRFCVVIRVFSSPPQRLMTSDFEGFLYQILSIALFSYLNSWETQLKHFNTSTATGYDNTNARFLKLSATVICPISYPYFQLWHPISNISKCLQGSSSCTYLQISNYRPISILPFISVVFERHVSLHLKLYLENNNLQFSAMTVLVYPIWFCTCIPGICCSITLPCSMELYISYFIDPWFGIETHLLIYACLSLLSTNL